MLYDNLGINKLHHLTFADYDTVALAKEYGTPLYVMDEARIRARCQTYKTALAKLSPGSHPLYASKALSTKRIYEIMAEETMGIDVVSSGEIHTAVKAGFPMEMAYFHGNNKTDFDIAYAMDCEVGTFVCDNHDEVIALNAEAARRGITQKILLRLTPGIDPHTHEKISTGKVDSKFGVAIETGQAEELILATLKLENLQLEGFHCHIGSQTFDINPFYEAAVLMFQFVAHMKEVCGYEPNILNLGGGMGVPYTDKDNSIDYAINIALIGRGIEKICSEMDLKVPAILMEPGRSIVADAGITLYTVGATKEIPGYKNYVSVDGGMTDNIRYALYQADYSVLLANRQEEKSDYICSIAGRCCESGDMIQENVQLPRPNRGDTVAVLTTGAYNYAMASTYNRIPRPAMVMIGKNGPYVSVARETLDDLIAKDL
ncbi:MAG: diaminopimelate decarboxylase [Eubacteriales bacterium]